MLRGLDYEEPMVRRFVAIALCFWVIHLRAMPQPGCASAVVGDQSIQEGEIMKAIGFRKNLPITDAESLVDVKLPVPSPGPQDILVRVKAVSVNPVDTKHRVRRQPAPGETVVLGWDAAGVVEQVGSDVRSFNVGDKVYYAGDITRPGTNSELHVVDHRIAALMPKTLSFSQAASVPLTALTAHEGLFKQLQINGPQDVQKVSTILVIGGAGGVGSMIIQMAKLSGHKVIATASRPETIQWAKDLGADYTINHRQPLGPQLRDLQIGEVDFIFNVASTHSYWTQMEEIIRPFGRICSIVESPEPVNLTLFMKKSVSFSWELMFTRSMFKTGDMSEQGRILSKVASWLDNGDIRHTVTEELSPINAANLRAAHAKLESGKGMGKIVLSGWGN